MHLEVWLGRIEVRQLPGTDHKIYLSGKGAFTWVTCWASDAEGYSRKTSKVMCEYGLFIAHADHVMSYSKAESEGWVTDSLYEQCEDTRKSQDFCILGTLHIYASDN